MTVKIKKTNEKPEEKSQKSCDKTCRSKSEELSSAYNELMKKIYEDVPVYTDTTGRIHVNKEYAKEFPELTNKLVEAEIEKNKSFVTKTDGYDIYYPNKTNDFVTPRTFYTSKTNIDNDQDYTISKLLKDILGPKTNFKYF